MPEIEVMPKGIVNHARAMEEPNLIVAGGNRCGRTIACRMATAKKVEVKVKADPRPFLRACRRVILSMYRLHGWKRFFMSDWWRLKVLRKGKPFEAPGYSASGHTLIMQRAQWEDVQEFSRKHVQPSLEKFFCSKLAIPWTEDEDPDPVGMHPTPGSPVRYLFMDEVDPRPNLPNLWKEKT